MELNVTVDQALEPLEVKNSNPPSQETVRLVEDATPTQSLTFDLMVTSGDDQIDALWSGSQWSGSQITYSFYDDDLGGSYYGDERGVSEISDTMKDFIRDILENQLESLINIDFVEVTDTESSYGQLRYMFSDKPNVAYGYYPDGDSETDGDVHFNPDLQAHFEAGPGSYRYETLIHETLHALGLKHPGDYNGDPGGGTPPFLPDDEDNSANTIMSYNRPLDRAVTPMPYDIKTLQYLYGTASQNIGNSTYSFSTVHSYTVDGNFFGSSSPIKQTLWDSRGSSDTLDFSNLAFASGYYFDLNEGGILTTEDAHEGTTYSHYTNGGSYSTHTNGTAIAYGVEIENLIGTSSEDQIFGNDLDNDLRSGGGDDIVYGSDRNDFLDGGEGDDFLIGDQLSTSTNPGQDVLYGEAGNDWLYAGEENDFLDGGEGDDFLSGAFGSSGSDIDTMTGGAGTDTFSLGYNGSFTEIKYLGTGYGIITDFDWQENDKIRYGGNVENYTLAFDQDLAGTSALDTTIYWYGDLIAVVQDTTDIVVNRDFLVPDDNYEENDTQATAYDFTTNEQTWLSSINDLGIANDEDWYEIEVPDGQDNLVVDLQFTHTDGDIDLALYDASGTPITSSASATDNESIDTIVPSAGTYYLQVYPYQPADAGNSYDLWWESERSEDNYEENDTQATAYNLTENEQTWLSTINDLGIANDEDWYEIEVPDGQDNLVVDLQFTHTDGDIDLALYDASGTPITSSASATDNESIDTIVPSAGTYYLQVYPYQPADAGNSYDLQWNALTPDDNYEENDTQVTAYDLTLNEQTWLNEIDGLGVSNEDDWYKIEIGPDYENLLVYLQFTHAEGDIDLALYDELGNFVTDSISTTDNESISTPLDAGIYYLNVYPYSGSGNTYDLWWDDVEDIDDDNYELNNTLNTAYDITGEEQTWLNEIDGLGIANEDDWYKIEISPDYENLLVYLEFTHAEGDIDLALYDELGNFVTSSTSTTDNESISTPLDAGIYYLNVDPYLSSGNTYDLWWDDVASF